MTTSDPFTFTQSELERVLEEHHDELFDRTRDVDDSPEKPASPELEPAPKLLIVAGVQGSGKTYLLENTLLPSNKYANYVPLYKTEYRTWHPRYRDMQGMNALDIYAHTESFIWALGHRIMSYALANKYNIIMESALDSLGFASFPNHAVNAGYRFEVHLIGCKRDFAHLSTIRRGLKSASLDELERFVSVAEIDQSVTNAEAILNAFEDACTKVTGSRITLYERGFGALRDRKVLCSSLCESPMTLTPQPLRTASGELVQPDSLPARIERTAERNKPCSYREYLKLINTGFDSQERQEAVAEAQASLQALSMIDQYRIPTAIRTGVAQNLQSYIERYSASVAR